MVFVPSHCTSPMKRRSGFPPNSRIIKLPLALLILVNSFIFSNFERCTFCVTLWKRFSLMVGGSKIFSKYPMYITYLMCTINVVKICLVLFSPLGIGCHWVPQFRTRYQNIINIRYVRRILRKYTPSSAFVACQF